MFIYYPFSVYIGWVEEVTGSHLLPIFVDLNQRAADGEEVQWPLRR